jgi:hypothetical protein
MYCHFPDATVQEFVSISKSSKKNCMGVRVKQRQPNAVSEQGQCHWILAQKTKLLSGGG